VDIVQADATKSSRVSGPWVACRTAWQLEAVARGGAAAGTGRLVMLRPGIRAGPSSADEEACGRVWPERGPAASSAIMTSSPHQQVPSCPRRSATGRGRASPGTRRRPSRGVRHWAHKGGRVRQGQAVDGGIHAVVPVQVGRTSQDVWRFGWSESWAGWVWDGLAGARGAVRLPNGSQKSSDPTCFGPEAHGRPRDIRVIGQKELHSRPRPAKCSARW